MCSRCMQPGEEMATPGNALNRSATMCQKSPSSLRPLLPMKKKSDIWVGKKAAHLLLVNWTTSKYSHSGVGGECTPLPFSSLQCLGGVERGEKKTNIAIDLNRRLIFSDKAVDTNYKTCGKFEKKNCRGCLHTTHNHFSIDWEPDYLYCVRFSRVRCAFNSIRLLDKQLWLWKKQELVVFCVFSTGGW